MRPLSRRKTPLPPPWRSKSACNSSQVPRYLPHSAQVIEVDGRASAGVFSRIVPQQGHSSNESRYSPCAERENDPRDLPFLEATASLPMSGESTALAPKRPIAVGHGRRCTMPVHRSGKNTNDSTVSLNRGPLTALVSMYTSNFSAGKSGTPHGGLRGSRPRRVAIALRNARAPTSQVCFDGPFELMMSWLAGSSDHAFPQRPPARRYRPNFRWVWTCDFWPRSRRVPRANWFLPRRFLEFGS